MSLEACDICGNGDCEEVVGGSLNVRDVLLAIAMCNKPTGMNVSHTHTHTKHARRAHNRHTNTHTHFLLTLNMNRL